MIYDVINVQRNYRMTIFHVEIWRNNIDYTPSELSIKKFQDKNNKLFR